MILTIGSSWSGGSYRGLASSRGLAISVHGECLAATESNNVCVSYHVFASWRRWQVAERQKDIAARRVGSTVRSPSDCVLVDRAQAWRRLRRLRSGLRRMAPRHRAALACLVAGRGRARTRVRHAVSLVRLREQRDETAVPRTQERTAGVTACPRAPRLRLD